MNNLASEQPGFLDRISKARGSSDLNETTEEPTIEVETPDDVEAIAEVETVETDETNELELVADNETEIYADFNGREISLTQINEWEKGSLRQSDYTRKTQALADERKKLETDNELLSSKNLKLDDHISKLEVFIGEFDNTEHDGMSLEELREYDASEYLKVTELQAKRKDALKKAKSLKSDDLSTQQQANGQKELQKLLTSNPHWIKDGKETQAYSDEMKLVEGYLTENGYSEAQQKGILLGGTGQVFIDAAKFHSNTKSNAAITKRVRKAPITTKPGQATTSTATRALEIAKENHKKSGTAQTAVELRKAQRKFKGE